MNTTCSKCEFATRVDGKQVGCEFDRINKYKNQKIEIELIEDSFLIKGRICNLCRATNSGWADDLTLEEKKEKAKKEVEIKLCAIVVVTPKTTIFDIIKTAKSLEEQVIPIDVNFVLTSNVPKSGDVISTLKKHFPSTSNLKWNVSLCFERRNGKPLDKPRALDTIVRDLNDKDYQFYINIDAGAILNKDIVEKLNKYLHEDLGQFIYLREIIDRDGIDEFSIGPVVHISTHKFVGGNAYAEHDLKLENGECKTIECNSVYEKIVYLAVDQNCQHLIKDLYEICCQE